MPFDVDEPMGKLRVRPHQSKTRGTAKAIQSKELITVLLVEDDEIDRILANRVLARQRPNIKFATDSAGSLSEATEFLNSRQYGVVLLDLMLPDSQGLETVRRVKGNSPDVPIVVLTGLDDEEAGISAMKAGAMDYLVKGRVLDNVLVKTIQYAIERDRLQRALRKAKFELEIKVEERTKDLSEMIELLKKEILDHRETEEQLHEAMEIKSQFVSVVSHELRIPLTALKEGIRLMAQEKTGRINDEQKEFLSLAQRNVDRLARLINDVLSFQKLDAGKMDFYFREEDINVIVKDVHDTMAPAVKRKGLDFILELGSGLPKARLDSDKIAQVVTNMIGNAIDFTERGRITLATCRSENVIQVSVSDTGCGIRREDLPRAFHEFEQLGREGNRKIGGSGLGLAISKTIIDQHRGKICVESESDQGTTFYFVLPIRERRTKDRE